MANRIYYFLEKYNLLDSNQNGFRKNHCTTLAVYKYVNQILNYLSDKQYAVGLLLDMTKAYDKVSHPILLDKLYGLGIRGGAHKWIKSYLQDRMQCVQIQHLDKVTGQLTNVQSGTLITNCSIPQGSVLGCILFLTYINDLPKITNHPCILFADDVSLLFKCPKHYNVDSDIKETVTELDNWLREHCLELNMKKTKLMQFRPYQKSPLDLTSVSNELCLEEVNTFSLLGLNIDTNLNWKKHIEDIRNKLSRFIFALGVLKRNTHVECALSAYFAYAYAWLRYGVILWGNSTDAHDLFVAQKKCVRILANIRQPESCRPYFAKLKLLTLPSIYILEVGLFVRKHISQFQFCKSERRNNKLAIPGHKLNIYRNGPYYQCIKIYNQIPESIKKEDKYNIFRSKLKHWLMDNTFYSHQEFMTYDLNT
jgi:hypothetical protein